MQDPLFREAEAGAYGVKSPPHPRCIQRIVLHIERDVMSKLRLANCHCTITQLQIPDSRDHLVIEIYFRVFTNVNSFNTQKTNPSYILQHSDIRVLAIQRWQWRYVLDIWIGINGFVTQYSTKVKIFLIEILSPGVHAHSGHDSLSHCTCAVNGIWLSQTLFRRIRLYELSCVCLVWEETPVSRTWHKMKHKFINMFF